MDSLCEKLNAKHRCEGVSFELWNGLPAIKVSTKACDAVIALNGGHVCEFTPKSSKHPLLWFSKSSNFAPGKTLRGGIPVCWPWFGGAQTPSHGIARISQWSVESVKSAPDGGTTIQLSFASSEETLKAWPYKFKCVLSIWLGNSLSVSLAVRNADVKPFSYTGALHSYISVSKITDVRVTGLEGVNYLDTLTKTRHVQEGPIGFGVEVDRIYGPTKGDCLVEDPGWGRKVRVARRGCGAAVVWNPWIAKSKRMPDFGDEEYWGMLCLEAANADADIVTVKPGETAELGTDISIEE